MKKSKEPIEVGAWQYDSMGRKFRKVGNSIEYAARIMTSSGTVYEDELEDHNRRMKAQTDQIMKERQEAIKAAYTGRKCPFKEARGGMHTICEKSCAFYEYENNICNFANMNAPAPQDTKNKQCPIVGRLCHGDIGDACAMYYNGGCTLVCCF